jgi:hypothetical protein
MHLMILKPKILWRKSFFFSWDQISSHFFQTCIFNFLRGGLGYLLLVWTWSNKTCKFSEGTDDLDMKLSKWGSFFKPIFIFNEASFFLVVEFKFLISLAIFSQGTDATKHVKFPFQTNIHFRQGILFFWQDLKFFFLKKNINQVFFFLHVLVKLSCNSSKVFFNSSQEISFSKFIT